MSWLWGCLIIFFKGCVGSVVFTILLIATSFFFAVMISAISWIFGSKKSSVKKKQETWQEWEQKQDGELKSLLTEIDKDLEK